MAGLLFNVVALVLGIIGAFQNRGRALAIGGACLNACVVVGIVLLIVIGITVKHTQAGS